MGLAGKRLQAIKDGWCLSLNGIEGSLWEMADLVKISDD
jgi:hypothetical protein